MRGASAGLVEQLAYYRAVADEYEDHTIDVPGQDELLSAIDSFRPGGDVLELACGTGIWTERLLRAATTVTAVGRVLGLLGLAQLELELTGLVGRDVDLRTRADLSRYFRDEVSTTARVLYDAA